MFSEAADLKRERVIRKKNKDERQEEIKRKERLTCLTLECILRSVDVENPYCGFKLAE